MSICEFDLPKDKVFCERQNKSKRQNKSNMLRLLQVLVRSDEAKHTMNDTNQKGIKFQIGFRKLQVNSVSKIN